MRLTFKGFLLAYCQELSGLQTSSLKKLAACAASEAPRVAEPLFLYALEIDRLDFLLVHSSGTWMEAGFRALAQKSEPYRGDAQRFLEECEVPERYAQVLDAYRSRTGAVEADRRVIALMRDKTNEALADKGITTYRLCKDLGLNMGNVYAYLGRGDLGKVSRDTARRIMEYAV